MKKLIILLLFATLGTIYGQDKDYKIIKSETKKNYIINYVELDSVVIIPKVQRYHYFIIYNPEYPEVPPKRKMYLITPTEKVLINAQCVAEKYDEFLKKETEYYKDTIYGIGKVISLVIYKKSYSYYYVNELKKLVKE